MGISFNLKKVWLAGCWIFLILLSSQSVIALGQDVVATVTCSANFSISIHGINISDEDDHVWGTISDMGEITCGPGGRKVLRSVKIGITPKGPDHLSENGVFYMCAPGNFPNYMAFRAAAVARGTDAMHVGSYRKIPVTLPLPCSPEAGEITLTISTKAPTLTEWGLIALGMLLAGSLAWMIRRKVAHRPAGA